MASVSASARLLVPFLTGAAIVVGLTADADAYAVKKTSRGELVHWESRTVDYTIDPSVDFAVPRATEATLQAMDGWSGTVGAPDLRIVDRDATSPETPGFDHKNGIFYGKGGYAPAGRALAITVLTYDNASGKILDADVIFNGSYTFKVLAAPGEIPQRAAAVVSAHPSTTTDGVAHEDEGVLGNESVYDLHHVIAHELGHSVGMNDEMGRTDALMYRYSAPNDATMRQPGSDDIAGLAELYSTKLEGRGNGCGSATIAPKKPSNAASRGALLATLGLLVFLVLRAKSDRRARIAFVVAAAGATIALVPTLSGKGGAGLARASESTALGHARAKVLATETAIDAGVFKTTYKLATSDCHLAVCPKDGHGTAWGGTIGNITQEVGSHYAPTPGDDVDVSFAALPSTLAALKPLAGRTAVVDADVRVLTRALIRSRRERTASGARSHDQVTCA